jgi:hypothetical protein
VATLLSVAPPSSTHKYISSKSSFICQIPARILKDGSLSSRARALYGLLFALADYPSGKIPAEFCSPKRIERNLRMSEKLRIKFEKELKKAGLLEIKREQVKRPNGSVYLGKSIYRVETQ